MSKTLLILTKNYPFNTGKTPAEFYIESEIPYIASEFERVLVVATEAPKNIPPSSSLPINVNAVPLGHNQTKKEKLLSFLSGLVPSFRIVADKTVPETIGQRVFRRYFFGKAKRKYRSLKKELKTIGGSWGACYSFWFHDTALLACWLKRDCGIERAVARAHGYDLYDERCVCGKLPFRTYMLNNLEAVLPCSENGELYLKSKHPQDANKIHRCYLGTRDLLDKSHEQKTGQFELVSCSAVVPVKRLDLLVRALQILDERGFEIRWTHFGDGECMPLIKKMCSGFRNIKIDLRGNTPNETVLKEYENKHYDLFANVSKSEGLPISIMEAMGTGVPVIATDVGGTKEIVDDGSNGFLISPDIDERSLASKLKVFIEMHGQKRLDMRLNARNTWDNKFRTYKNVRDLLTYLIT